MKRAKKSDENKVDYGTISLPTPLIDKVKKRIKGTGMNSVSSYVSFVLREVLSRDFEKSYKEEFEKVREKLKRLGY